MKKIIAVIISIIIIITIVLIILISFCTSLIFSIFHYYSGFFNMEDFSPLFPSIGLGIIIYLYIVKKYKELAGVIFLTIAYVTKLSHSFSALSLLFLPKTGDAAV